MRSRRINKIGAALGLAMAGLLAVVVGCGSASTTASTSSATAGFVADQPGPPEVAAAATSAAAGGKQSAAASAGAGALDNRQIVRTADLQIGLTVRSDVSDDNYNAERQSVISAAVANARAQAITAGGFVADLQQSTTAASLVIRIPADKYESYRTAAEQLGDVMSNTESAQDVTGEYTDVTSRIASMRTSIERLRTLLAGAINVADVIAVESELTGREADLESLQGRQAVLTDQVSLATISITFSASRDSLPAPDPKPDRGGFLGGLANGWQALVTFLTGLSVAVGAFLPFVPLIAIVAAVGWWVVRRSRSRRTLPNGRLDSGGADFSA